MRGSKARRPASIPCLPVKRGFAAVAVRRDLSTLLDASQLHGIRDALALVADILHADDAQDQCSHPTVLLHGSSWAEMQAVVHLVARQLERPLVQVFASLTLPRTDGGSQPLIASALNPVRDSRGSVLWLDQLERLAGTHHRTQRAFHDLLHESVRPSFAPAAAIIGTYVDSCSTSPPPTFMAGRFDRCRVVHLPDLVASTANPAATN